ncbi:MAG: hypothetical protein SV429_08600 [Pseudomonadota bacterium]|nr:hypothetical protein [Pseudomonadota bacterium]
MLLALAAIMVMFLTLFRSLKLALIGIAPRLSATGSVQKKATPVSATLLQTS